MAVAPGIEDTSIIQGYKDKGQVDSMKVEVMGNKLTQPEQVADSVYLLSIEEESGINGVL